MKNTQKKLKAKHFRYLSKKNIKNPMIYIRDFFQQQTDIINWQKDINLFVTTGAYPAMSTGGYPENGYNCHQMIKQMEIAYVIFKQCGLPKHKNPLTLFDTRKDYFNYSYGPEFTCNNKKSPYDLIRKFFSYQPLQKWYKTMDGLMEQLTLKRSIGDEHFGDKIVVIREFLIRLAYALYYIYEHGGITIPLPPYVHMESRKPREEAESNNESLDDPHDIRDEEKMSEINSTKLETENKAQI
ncbi:MULTISPECIES: hypothetical protein [Sphingobacterium]|jgi:hypothetical protein|uniref:hypothetical protein n=1 Tax=Sphingobacterium TaxID=28453 RepID=UPI000389F9F3|nr:MULTISPECIES: hypothetical protein [Sphingobacterium]KKX51042.1 hypothetical protein L950_0207240 [Sphingobacterium sp. IITKGP-BTPF85]MCW2262325.1 hypothetical protein [Sphingobacterium kitahiroshimense]NJI74773.1 hypothetical protein [Sphingobacterium sp. B16(2022)]TCR12927.1 hypothetical protein EDF67_102339 [Sphingobacterium sp. JUb78]